MHYAFECRYHVWSKPQPISFIADKFGNLAFSIISLHINIYCFKVFEKGLQTSSGILLTISMQLTCTEAVGTGNTQI